MLAIVQIHPQLPFGPLPWVQVILAERLINPVVLLQPSCSHYGSHSEDKIVSATRQSCTYIMCQFYQCYFTALKPAPPQVSHSQKNQWFWLKIPEDYWMKTLARPYHQCSTLWVDTVATSQCLHSKMQAMLVKTSAVPSIWSPYSGHSPYWSISCLLEETNRGPTCWIDIVQYELEQLALDPSEVEETSQSCKHWHSIVDLVGLMPQHEN